MHIFPSFFSLSLSYLSLCHILSSRTKRTSVRNFFSKNLLSRVTVFQDGERRLLAESASNFNPSCTPLPPMYNKSFNPDGKGGEEGDLGVARRNARLRTSFFTPNSERIFREEDNRGKGATCNNRHVNSKTNKKILAAWKN